MSAIELKDQTISLRGRPRDKPRRSACWRGAAGSRSCSPRRRGGRGCRWPASGSGTRHPKSCAASATRSRSSGVAKLGGMIRVFGRQGVRAGRHGGQGDQERDVHARGGSLQLCPDLRMLQMVVPPQPRGQSRRHDLALGDRRVRARRDDVRLGPGLLPGAARERRNTHPPARRRRPSRKTSSSAGRWPRRWAGSTSASRSPSRKRPPWPSRPSRGPTAASSGPASSAGPAAGPSSRSPSRSRTCGSTCRRSAFRRSRTCTRPGRKVLAIEAGKTILLDQPEVVALADRYGLTIISIG